MKVSDGEEIEQALQDLLAQMGGGMSPQDSADLSRLIWSGSYRGALESLCRHTAETRQPLPMHARAMVFRLADRLDANPADLGLLG